MKEKIKERRKQIEANLKNSVNKIKENLSRSPVLFSLKIGEDPSSDVYRESLKKKADKLGIELRLEQNQESHAEEILKEANRSEDIDGIIIHCSRGKMLHFSQFIAPEKDVEGITPWNLGRLLRGEATICPATPLAVLEILNVLNYDLEGKRTLIIGRSLIVGKPLFLLLLQKNATITVAHSRTRELGELTRNAELIILAAGKPALLKPDMVSPATLVVDVGINVVGKKVVGDADPSVGEKAILTPVPGGVGTFTPYMLFSNLIKTIWRKIEGETSNSPV